MKISRLSRFLLKFCSRWQLHIDSYLSSRSSMHLVWKQQTVWCSHTDRHIPFLQSNLVFQQILQSHSYCAKKMRSFASCELCRQEFGISLSMFAICPCIRYVCYFQTHITRRLILLGNKSLSVRYITYKKMHKIALPKIPLHAKVIYSKYWRNLYLFVSIFFFLSYFWNILIGKTNAK